MSNTYSLPEKYKNRICPALFYDLEIENNGQVYFCCEHRLTQQSIGNIFEMPFDKIWNSEFAVNIRREALNGRYPYCNAKICHRLVNNISEHFTLINESHKPILNKYPKQISFPLDKDCNARCIFCRDKNYISTNEEISDLWQKFNKFYFPIFNDLECLTVNDSGDAFSSKFSRELIKTVSLKFPHIKFRIMTNGILATRELINELNIKDKILKLDISVNAVTAKTHSKIFRTNQNAFKQVMKNLEYISSLNIPEFNLNFIVCQYNWKEMKDFVYFGKRYNARISFWEVRDFYHDALENKMKDIAVHIPTHKDYKKFKKSLTNRIFDIDEKNIIMSPVLKNLRKEALEEKKSVFHFFKSVFNK